MWILGRLLRIVISVCPKTQSKFLARSKISLRWTHDSIRSHYKRATAFYDFLLIDSWASNLTIILMSTIKDIGHHLTMQFLLANSLDMRLEYEKYLYLMKNLFLTQIVLKPNSKNLLNSWSL